MRIVMQVKTLSEDFMKIREKVEREEKKRKEKEEKTE